MLHVGPQEGKLAADRGGFRKSAIKKTSKETAHSRRLSVTIADRIVPSVMSPGVPTHADEQEEVANIWSISAREFGGSSKSLQSSPPNPMSEGC